MLRSAQFFYDQAEQMLAVAIKRMAAEKERTEKDKEEASQRRAEAKEARRKRMADTNAHAVANCQIKSGDVVEGVVQAVKPYGAFVRLEGGVVALLHVSQISQHRIQAMDLVLSPGERIKVRQGGWLHLIFYLLKYCQ